MKPFTANYPVTFSYLRRYSNGNPHKGIDYGAPWRSPLVAAVNGTVWYAGFGGGWGAAYGGQVIIKFTHGGKTRYLLTAHMNEISVKTGQKVTMGQSIGRSGGRPGTKGAGNTTGAHVHVQVNSSTTWSAHINPQFAMDLGKATPVETKPKLTPEKRTMWFELQQDLNVRDFPHTKWGKVLKTLPKNTVIKIVAEDKVDGQWWDEWSEGGWLAQDYMLATHNPKSIDTQVYVCDVDLANLREQPYAGSRDIGDLKKGDEFKAVGFDKGYADDMKWLVDKNHHWVRADLMKVKGAAPAKPPVVEPIDPVALTILPRSAWTSTPDNRNDKLDVSKITALTCHYPADGNVTYLGLTQEQVAANLERYRKHHTQVKGWKDIGYNYAIDQAGRCWFLTGDDIGAHAGTVGNTTSIGVLFVIGNLETPSDAAVATFKKLLALKRKTFTKITKVQGHQQVPGNSTECPGPELMKMIKAGTLDLGNDAPTQPPVVVDPKPVDRESLPLRVGSLNVIGRRLTKTGKDYTTEGGLPIKDVQKGTDYKDRTKLLAKKNDIFKADIIGTQESGTYAMGDDLGKKLGTENILHGDNGDLTNAVHWMPKRFRMLKEGVFTVPGRDHKFATWVMLEDIPTHRDVLTCSFHADHRRSDATLKAQSVSLAKQLKALSGGTRVIVVTADANESRDEPSDEFGKALKAAGFIETEVSAKVKKNAQFSTMLPTDSTTPKKNTRHIDRIWVWLPPGCTVEVLEWGIAVELTPSTNKIPQPVASDHWGVWSSLLFTYTKETP